MSKAVLMSVSPKQCYQIAFGEQTVIVRKTKPKIETPFKVYIYCTIGGGTLYQGLGLNWKCFELFYHTSNIGKNDSICFNSKVIGEFVCDKIDGFNYGVHEPYGATNWQDCYKGYPEELCDMEGTCLTVKEINNYGSGRFLYAWHISNIVIYDKPKELSEFCTLDNEAVQKCENRQQTYYAFTDTGYIKNGMYCGYKDDWCIKCKRKMLKRPPQSWCYVEECVNN